MKPHPSKTKARAIMRRLHASLGISCPTVGDEPVQDDVGALEALCDLAAKLPPSRLGNRLFNGLLILRIRRGTAARGQSAN